MIEGKNGWQIRTLADAYAPRPPKQYIVDGLLTLPSLSIVYGRPGCLKTMLMIDMAASVAGGEPWLPRLAAQTNKETARPTIQAPVFFADFDNGADTMDERIEAAARARGLSQTTPLHYVSMPKLWLDMSNERYIPVLQDNAGDAKLIIVDNLLTISGDADENSAQIATVLTNLRRVAEGTGAAVVVIHHQRKNTGYGQIGDTLRGHSSINGAIDLALLIERDDYTETVKVQSTKTRKVQVEPFGAMFTFTHKPNCTDLAETRFWGIELEEEPGSNDAIQRAMLEVVTDNPGINKTALTKEVKELAEAGTNRIRRMIDKLAQNGELRQENGAGTSKLYYIGDEFDHAWA